MRHNPIKVNILSDNELENISTLSYDSSYLLKNKAGNFAIKTTYINSGSVHVPMHYFLPWGWDFSVAVIRKYNLYLQKNYHGDIYFYSLKHIKLSKLDSTKPALYQLAKRWLEAQLELGVIKPSEKILVAGTSMGGTIAASVGAIAHKYDVILGNLNIFEPAGLSKKTPLAMSREVSYDTKEDFIESFGSMSKVRKAKVGIFLHAIKNSRFQTRCIKEIAQGKLYESINAYLESQMGEVQIGHGTNSSFMTINDLDKFAHKLIDPSRVQSFDFIGYKHSMGGNPLGLADWFSKQTATCQ